MRDSYAPPVVEVSLVFSSELTMLLYSGAGIIKFRILSGPCFGFSSLSLVAYFRTNFLVSVLLKSRLLELTKAKLVRLFFIRCGLGKALKCPEFVILSSEGLLDS